VLKTARRHPGKLSIRVPLEGPLMRKFFLLLAAALLGLVATASSASAAVNVKTAPTISFLGASATLTDGNFSGLGNVPVSAELTVTGLATYECRNPNGHASPGQNPVAAQSGSSGPKDLGNADHNGRGTVTGITASVTAPLPTPTAQAVGCGGTGNTKWTVVNTGLTATAARLVLTQGGTTVYCRTFTLLGPATGTAC
jgi:hypothetical protein